MNNIYEKAYKFAFDAFQEDSKRFWTVFNVMVVANGALVAFAAHIDPSSQNTFFLGVVGMSICFCWFLVQLRYSSWVRSWEKKLQQLEVDWLKAFRDEWERNQAATKHDLPPSNQEQAPSFKLYVDRKLDGGFNGASSKIVSWVLPLFLFGAWLVLTTWSGARSWVTSTPAIKPVSSSEVRINLPAEWSNSLAATMAMERRLAEIKGEVDRLQTSQADLARIQSGSITSSSGKHYTVSRISKFVAAGRREAGPTLDEQKMIDANCLWGMPEHLPGVPHGPTKFVYHQGYVLEFSGQDKFPLWVEEHVTKEQLTGPLTRTSNPFRTDPQLNGFPHSALADYSNSGYDRGHNAPAGDQTVDKTLKSETFFLSNMSPQVPELNRRAWSSLEELARTWIVQRGDGYIITGGFLYDPKEEDTASANGLVQAETIGDGQVAVPTHFYKIVVARNPDTHAWEAVSFVMENRQYPSPYRFDLDIVTLDWIEKHTGLHFMPKMLEANPDDPNIQQRLETVKGVLWDATP